MLAAASCAQRTGVQLARICAPVARATAATAQPTRFACSTTLQRVPHEPMYPIAHPTSFAPLMRVPQLPARSMSSQGQHRKQHPTAGPAGVLPVALRKPVAGMRLQMADKGVKVVLGTTMSEDGRDLSHHNPSGGFRNPWGSFEDLGAWDFMTGVLPELKGLDTYDISSLTPLRPEVRRRLQRGGDGCEALFIGHASFMLQLAGWNILTDPVFSRRAAPVQWMGPHRYSHPAVAAEHVDVEEGRGEGRREARSDEERAADIPGPVHIVVLSHNHYDHIDKDSIRILLKKERMELAKGESKTEERGVERGEGRREESGAERRGEGVRKYTGTLFVCPLGNSQLLQALGVDKHRIVELDWWQSFTPGVAGRGEETSMVAEPAAGTINAWISGARGEEMASGGAAPSIVCVPAQHQSARTFFDRNESLWCGFAFLARDTRAGKADRVVRAYFSGDTGYRNAPKGVEPLSAQEAALPSCPAFKEIGERCGPFDLAMLPIGAYSPRWFMSSFHASPEDSVQMHKDVRSKRSVAMHWATFPLTDEPIEEPPLRLAAARQAAGIPEEEFASVLPGTLVSADSAPAPAEGVVTPRTSPLSSPLCT